MEVYLNPNKAWEYYTENKHAKTLIAETDRGVEVYITEDNNYPTVIVEYKDIVLENECAISENDLSAVIKKLLKIAESYNISISPYTIDDREFISAYEYIDSRENELLSSLTEFLKCATNAGEEEFHSIELNLANLSDILNDIEDLLYHSYNICVHRPRFITVGDEVFLQEYLFESEESF